MWVASPALRPGLTGTRRRNAGGDLWPGGWHILEALAERRDLVPVDPFALGCTAHERTPSARRRSAITTRPQACRESNTCAHKGGGSERHGRQGAACPTWRRWLHPASPRSSSDGVDRSSVDVLEPVRKLLDLALQSASHLCRRRHGRRQPESRDARTHGNPVYQMVASGVRADGAEGERGPGRIARDSGLRRRGWHLRRCQPRLYLPVSNKQGTTAANRKR